MKKLVFALTGVAALTLAACSGNNQDAVNNAELNQPSADQLNQLSSDAANDAANAEAAALGSQQQQLESENAAADNTANPSDDEEQNVSGM
jgi:outer membrane biogenesis lipoprotein LolB